MEDPEDSRRLIGYEPHTEKPHIRVNVRVRFAADQEMTQFYADAIVEGFR